jgi:hypothetical protein
MFRNRNYLLIAHTLLFLCIISIDADSINLLQNSGFEENNIDKWRKEYWVDGGTFSYTEKKVHSGKGAAVLSTGNVSNDIRLVQTLDVKPDHIYRLSGWIAAENIGTEEDKVGANLSIMGTFAYTGNIKGTQDWQYAEMDFTTKPDQTSLTVAIRIGMYYGANTGVAYFDDVGFVEIGPAAGLQGEEEPGHIDEERNNFTILWIALIIITAFVVAAVLIIPKITKKKQ